MQRLFQGSILIDSPVQTLQNQTVSLRKLTNDAKTALFFLRDASCVLTQSYLCELARAAELFRRSGIRIVAVVNASVESASHVLSPSELPFEVVCDREGALYGLYGVGCAASREALGNGRTMERIKAAYAAGFVHGTDTGDPLRLPAWFLFDREGRAQCVHYGALGDDLPPADELIRLLGRPD